MILFAAKSDHIWARDGSGNSLRTPTCSALGKRFSKLHAVMYLFKYLLWEIAELPKDIIMPL